MEKYKGVIDIKCGLELEYFPKYNSYYEWLNGKAGLDGIILGQHMYSMPDGRYRFSLTPEELLLSEADGLAELEVLGILSGYFKVVAHPDRCFRRQTLWTEKAERLSKDIIKAAVDHNIPLEKNISSIRVTERYNLHHF